MIGNTETQTEQELPATTLPFAPKGGRDVVPPLQAGDRLTRSEFERRYHHTPPHIKAELIEGMVYMPSPVRVTSHGFPTVLLITWLGVYSAATKGVQPAENTTVRLDMDNEVQPDALLRLNEALNGHSRITSDDYLEGAPELIVEVAASTAAYDLHDKLNVYRRNGVMEYIVWVIYEQRLEWFRLQEDAYVPLPVDADGTIRSQIFPGLHLDVQAMLTGDLAAVLARLEAGIHSEEHAAFVQDLATRQ